MQKILLSLLLLGATLSAVAQAPLQQRTSMQPNKAQNSIPQKYRAVRPTPLTGFEENTTGRVDYAPAQSSQRATVGVLIGTSAYDLQSNSGVCRRVLVDGNNVHAMYTKGEVPTAYTNRGTAYNMSSDGGETWGAAPTARIETIRTGWPNIGLTRSGRLFSMTHTGATGLNFCYKDPGQEWIDRTLGDEYGDNEGVWARAANVGDTIIAVIGRQCAPDATPATVSVYNDVCGGLALFRSFDNGETWALDTIPFLGQHFAQIQADDYFIDAHGSTVALVVSTYAGQTVLYKSTDAGLTWSHYFIKKTENPTASIFAANGSADQVWKPIMGSNGSNSVLIDNNGLVHVWSDRTIYYKAPSDTGGPYFTPGFGNALTYWNESMGEDPSTSNEDDPVRVLGQTALMDMSGDCRADFANYDVLDTEGAPTAIQTNSYGAGNVGQVSSGIDSQGNLYVTYCSVVDGDYEQITTGGELTANRIYRDVFVIKSLNGGQSWVGPYNVTADNGKSEDVYPTMAREVNGFVHLVYQADNLTGTNLQNTNSQGHATVTVNEFRYVKLPVDDIIAPTVVNNTCPDQINGFYGTFSVAAPANCIPTPAYFTAFAIDHPDGDLTPDIVTTSDFDNTTPGDDLGKWVVNVTDAAGNLDSDTLTLVDGSGNEVLISIYADDAAPNIIRKPYELVNGTTLIDWFTDATGTVELYETPESEQIDIATNDTYVDFGAEAVDDYSVFGCPVELTTDNPVNTAIEGQYTVTYTATDLAGNSAEAIRTVNVGNIGIDGLDNRLIISTFPNPSKGNFELSLGDYNGAVTVNVYSVAGNLLLQAQRNYAGPMLLSMGKQPAGIYVLEVITSQGKATQKIVVEK